MGFIRVKSAPCKNCENRKLMCHDTCDLYKAYREDLRKKNKYLKDNQIPSGRKGEANQYQ